MKKIIINWVIIVGLFMIFVPFSQAGTELNLSVVSEYQTDNSSSSLQYWKIKYSETSETDRSLKFFPIYSEDPICTLSISDSEIKWQGPGKQKTSVNGLLLLPEFPVPCSILPMSPKSDLYEDVSEAGGRLFTKKYKILKSKITIQEALEKGWIKSDLIDTSGLIMITVYDELNKLVTRQLWPEQGTWWIYEETLFRRSWLEE